MITFASPTRLLDFEACPRRARLKYHDRVPEPRDPNSPLDRGTRMHEELAAYLTGQRDTLSFAIQPKHQDLVETLRAQYAAHPERFIIEQRWQLDDAWAFTQDWDQTRIACTLDLLQFDDDDRTVAHLIDWKSGGRHHNVVKHLDQMQFYALAALLAIPSLELIHASFIYLDLGETMQRAFHREQGEGYLTLLTPRIARLVSETQFLPRPSKYTCRWCPFKTGEIARGVIGTGHCDLNPE